jgi:hypothetical protein
MNWDVGLLWFIWGLVGFFVLTSLGGFACIVVVVRWWQFILPFFAGSASKWVITVARFASGTAAVAPRFGQNVPGDQLVACHWLCIAAITSWATWEACGILGDRKAKASEAIARKDLDAAQGTVRDLRRRAGLLTSLLTFFRKMTLEKRERLAKVAGQAKKFTLARSRDALAPRYHLYRLLEGLGFVLRGWHPDPQSEEAARQNFRIGLYVAEGGILKPWAAFDFATSGTTPFISFRDADAHFRLDNNDKPSHAVRSILESQLIIEPDCVAAAERGEFVFYRTEQRDYLRSLVAYPLKDFRLPDGTETQAALVIDTNVPGHFAESDRDLLAHLLAEFDARIRLETAILGLLRQEPRELSDGTPSNQA